MADEDPPEAEEDEGGGWIMTFADLMSLLMCFFVLLLSFAELDLKKFKAIAGSMKLAFGVQREIQAPDVPMGTSLIKTEFSPGKPEPTVINSVQQATSEPNKQTLELSDALNEPGDGGLDGEQAEEFKKTQEDAKKLIAALKEEVDAGLLQVETRGTSIVIRIREKASFPSGQAKFHNAFLPVVKKLRESLKDIEGKIAVAGHTDNIPIKTARFRSNWDLSAARAVSVLHQMIKDAGNTPGLDPTRLIAEGHGDARPLVPNDTAENRAINRRVELTIVQSTGKAEPVEEPLALIGNAQAGTQAGPESTDNSPAATDNTDSAPEASLKVEAGTQVGPESTDNLSAATDNTDTAADASPKVEAGTQVGPESTSNAPATDNAEASPAAAAITSEDQVAQ